MPSEGLVFRHIGCGRANKPGNSVCVENNWNSVSNNFNSEKFTNSTKTHEIFKDTAVLGNV